jgi:predicted DNA-binding protein (MmcQ/YjbR family)
MDIEYLRTYCLAKPNVEETLPFGPDVLVFKVSGKIFLLSALDEEELRFSVKCDPDLAIELRESYACVIPGYHLNKKHWNTVIVDGTASATQLKEWIDHSYDLVAKSVPSKAKPKSKTKTKAKSKPKKKK